MSQFIFTEQALNNYTLYNGTDIGNSFKINLELEFLPKNQKPLSHPYFLIPLNKNLILYKEEKNSFFTRNYFHKKSEKVYYSFFIHPEILKISIYWINRKYELIDNNKNIYNATPTSVNSGEKFLNEIETTDSTV